MLIVRARDAGHSAAENKGIVPAICQVECALRSIMLLSI